MRIAHGALTSPAAALPITSGNQTVESARVSADHRWLIYDSDRGGNTDVHRIPNAGGNAIRV